MASWPSWESVPGRRRSDGSTAGIVRVDNDELISPFFFFLEIIDKIVADRKQ